MQRHLTRLLKSVRKLGLRHGLAVFGYYLLHRLHRGRRWQAREVSLGTLPKPIWLRPGVSDWIVMERIFLDEEYDPVSAPHDAAMAALANRIAAGGKSPLIIDCGANIGLASIWFATRFPRALVVAIEPEPANYDILSRNCRNYPNIVPLQAAVCERMARVDLRNDGQTPWAWQTRESPTGAVEGVTIAHVLQTYSQHELFAMKIDIEGFEVNVLNGDTQWADRLPMMVFEMHDWMAPWSGSGHAFFSVLNRRKRDYLLRGENVFAYTHDLLHRPLADSTGDASDSEARGFAPGPHQGLALGTLS